MDLCLALDIGGTKMAAAAVDRSGVLHISARRPTPHSLDPETHFDTVVELVDEVRQKLLPGATLVRCGVGCGGPMSAEGETVSPLNISAWRDFPLRARLSQMTGLAVHVDNDAKALALGEAWRGAARGQRNFLAMVVSTGIGGGIVSDGRLVQGDTGNAGHIGHVVVEPDGRRCRCGGQGCLEAEASGLAIESVTGAAPAEASNAVVSRTGQLVGRAAASVVQLLDLPLVVVAGSVALGFGAPFFEAASQELRHRAGLSFARHARIVPAGLGGDGPIIGAAAVGWQLSGSDIEEVGT